MDHCTEIKKRSGQTGSWGKNIYWDGRIGIATGIAPISKRTPSRILLTSSMTAHPILSCTKPRNKIPYPTDVTTTRNTRKPNHYWRWQWRIRWTKWQLLHCRVDLFHTSLLLLTLSRMHWSTTSIFWMSTTHMRSLLSMSSRTPSVWLFRKKLKLVTSTMVGDIVKLFFFSDTCVPCSSLLFFIYDWHAFTLRQTHLLHMFTSPLQYVLHVFTSRLTHFVHLFKPVVRQ